MDAPATPPAQPGPEGALGRAPTEPVGAPEEEGPLRLQRFRKPDGRALIVFERRDAS